MAASSSLEKQLKRLRIPDNSSLERATKFKKRASFLFDAKEACDIDNETVYALALNGLDELKLINERFETFESTIFNESSKHVERSLQSKEVNDKLDQELKQYLRLLSPYILLKPAHKTLEWLIRRFQVQLYNIDDLLACVFPYHQSNIFARVVQLLNIVNTKWSWLVSVRKTGSALPRSAIIQHCLANPAFLHFLSGLVFDVITDQQPTANLTVFSSFYASIMLGALESIDKVSVEILTGLMNPVLQGLKSDVQDLKAASYMIIGQLSRKCTLELSVVESLLRTILKNATASLSESMLMCITCLCSTHSLECFPKKVFLLLCQLPNFATLVCDLSNDYKIDAFLKIFLPQLIKRVLKQDAKEASQTDLLSCLLTNLLRDINLDDHLKLTITREMLLCYIEARRTQCNKDEVVAKLHNDVKAAMRVIQNRWQSQLGQVVQEYLVNLQERKPDKEALLWTQDFVEMALSSVASQIVCESESTLIVALHHPEAEFRKLALKKVSSILKNPVEATSDKEFLKESLLVKLCDDDPSVVLTVLELNKGLVNICQSEELVTALVQLLNKDSKKWFKVFEKALSILLSDTLLETSSCSKDNVLFRLLSLMLLTKGADVDYVKLIIDHLKKSSLMPEWLLNSLRKKSLNKAYDKCTDADDDAAFDQLTVANAMLVCSMAENITLAGNELVLKLMKAMQRHCQEAGNPQFVMLYLMLSVQLLSITNDDSLKFELISTLHEELLSLIKQAIEVKSSRVKVLSNASVEPGKDCGIVPVSILASYLTMLGKKSVKKLHYVECKLYLYCLQHVIKYLPVNQSHVSPWWKMEEDKEICYTKILMAIFEVIVNGLSKGNHFKFEPDFQMCLQIFIKEQFPKKEHFLKFLTFLWHNTTSRDVNLADGRPSALAVIQSLHIAQMLLSSFDDNHVNDIISHHSQVIPSLLVCLTSPIMAVRETVLQILEYLVSRASTKMPAVQLCIVLCESAQEITADEAFILSVLQRYISSETSDRRKSKSQKSRGKITSHDVLDYMLQHVIDDVTPLHVSRVLLSVLNDVTTKTFLLTCLPLMKMIINKHKTKQDCSSDQSQILLHLVKKFTPQTVSLLKTDPRIFEVFQQLLTFSKPFFTGHKTAQEAVLNQMTAQFFESIGDEGIQNEILGKLIDVVMETSDPKMSGKLKDVLKVMPLTANQIHVELTKMTESKKDKTGKTKSVTSDDWYSSLGVFWQRVVIIVELLQTKDNIEHVETLLSTLFKILSMCLEMTEQASSDYLRQLLLSAILKIFTAHVDQGKHLTRGTLSEEHFSVEQIIHCIRISGNPQTHHHALCLLALGAQLFPEKVLHNVMSIFTFMGVNVLRQDDTYSFQVIEKTVEAVIPALIQAEQSKPNVQTLVTKILRVFVDAFPHVPEHRRLPIFFHLLTTLGVTNYLHLCLALLLEKIRRPDATDTAKINVKESALIFCHSLCDEFSPEAQMTSLIYLIKYLGSLPDEKPQGYRKRHADASGIIFDINSHSEKDLHLFKLSVFDLIVDVLTNENLQEKVVELPEDGQTKMDRHYLSLLEETMQYITSASKLLESSQQDTTAKYLRVLLRKVYDVVEKVCDLLPRATFINIISQLIQNNNQTIRKKALELFNKKMASGVDSSLEKQAEMLLVLHDSVIKLLQQEDETAVNKQSAFNTMIILAKVLGDNHSQHLKKGILVATAAFSSKDTKPQVSSAALLYLAQICSVLKAHVIPFLDKFTPNVLKIMENGEARSGAVLLGALAVLHKLVQVLPNFLSPYLRTIVTLLISPILAHSDEGIKDDKPSLKTKIAECTSSLRDDIGVLVKPRILIPKLSQCYDDVVLNDNNDSVIVLFHVLGKCVANMSKEDINNHNNQLLSLFISALDYRSQHHQDISEDRLLTTEHNIIDAFLTLIMRLSESLFRPMFLKLVDWATRSSSTKLKLLTFYHLADRMAEKLKGLFVLFAGYITKNAASVLDANNLAKTEKVFFVDNDCKANDEEGALGKSCQLLHYILDCLYKCFLYDNQRFVNKERFDRLLLPLVDQIENSVGDDDIYRERTTNHLAPCIAQFAVAAGDESYWKTINHHVCLKTRHSSSQVRLGALKVIRELNNKLGEEYLSLLPEIIPFLAELMEDDSFEVEQECQQLISEIESVLGESLQKYF